MNKKFTSIIISVLAASILLTGCGSSSSKSKDAYPVDDYAASAAYDTSEMYAMGWAGEPAMEEAIEEAAEMENGASMKVNAEMDESTASSALAKRKLIKNVNMSVQTKEFDKLISNIENKIDELGGYAESLNVQGTSYDEYSKNVRTAYIVARIPGDKLDMFVSNVGEQSNVTNKNEYTEDVTLRYSDIEAHKESLRIEQERLNELVAEAEDVDTIVILEERLGEIRYELESYESQLRTMDNQVSFSTVSIDVTEVKDYTPEPADDPTYWERLKENVSDACEDAWEGFGDFIIGFISAIPYILMIAICLGIVALIIFAIYKLIRKIFRKSFEEYDEKARKRKEARKAAHEAEKARKKALNDAKNAAKMSSVNMSAKNAETQDNKTEQ